MVMVKHETPAEELSRVKAELAAERALICDLVFALQPFADALGNIADKDLVRWPDNSTIEHDGAAEEITWGDLRKARTVVAKAMAAS